MKTKFLGVFCLLIAIVSFVDAVKNGGLSIGTLHLRPFILPAYCLGMGWIELHGRDKPLQGRCHHSHVLAYLSIAAILLSLFLVLKK